MNSRPVHLELAKSLETDDFILVLIRFLNSRGHVMEIRSDNGANFVGADKEIRELIVAMKHSKLERELSQRRCNWVFTPGVHLICEGYGRGWCELSREA